MTYLSSTVAGYSHADVYVVGLGGGGEGGEDGKVVIGLSWGNE